MQGSCKQLSLSKQESKITNLYVGIKKNLKNTFFTFKRIEKYKRQYECFLKSITDYLVDGGIWWKENKDGVEFFDNGPVPENTSMNLTHFRSTTIKQQLSHIFSCWEWVLLDKNNIIPAHSVEMKQSNQCTILASLKYFSNNDPPTENSFMQITSELDNTVYPNLSRNSQTTIQYVPSSSIKLDLSSISAATDFINSTGKNDILNDTTMSSEPENKPIKQTSTPIVNYETTNRSKKDIIYFKIQPIPPLSTTDTCAQPSKSTKKLISLFGEAPFVKSFDIARKKIKKDNQNLIFK